MLCFIILRVKVLGKKMKENGQVCYKCAKNKHQKFVEWKYYKTVCDVCLKFAYNQHVHYLCAICNKKLAITSGKYDKT